MTQVSNLLANLPDATTEEMFEMLASAKGVEIERIVSHGQCSPEVGWYDQDRHEWVLVLSGAARLEFDESGAEVSVEMGPGDAMNIPARCRHRVAWTTPDQPTVWLAVHYPAEELEGLE